MKSWPTVEAEGCENGSKSLELWKGLQNRTEHLLSEKEHKVSAAKECSKRWLLFKIDKNKTQKLFSQKVKQYHLAQKNYTLAFKRIAEVTSSLICIKSQLLFFKAIL